MGTMCLLEGLYERLENRANKVEFWHLPAICRLSYNSKVSNRSLVLAVET